MLLLCLQLAFITQHCRLKKPDAKEILTQQSSTIGARDAIHIYLLQNYKSLSEIYTVGTDSTDYLSRGAYFKQEFENGISIQVLYCKQSDCDNITELTLPKTKTKSKEMGGRDAKNRMSRS